MNQRYRVKERWTFILGTRIKRYQIWDRHSQQFVGRQYTDRKRALQAVDKTNGRIAREADAYRKAKDCG